MSKVPVDPLGPITIEQSKASAAILGALGLIGGIALVLVSIAGVFGVFSPGREGMGVHALYAGFLGLGSIAYGRSQIKLSKQEMRTHFHADLEGMRGLVFGTPDLVTWSAVESIQGWITDLDIKLLDGRTIHIQERLVGLAKGLKGLPSSKKIAERLENLRTHATELSTKS
jgi:hypothetical protein